MRKPRRWDRRGGRLRGAGFRSWWSARPLREDMRDEADSQGNTGQRQSMVRSGASRGRW